MSTPLSPPFYVVLLTAGVIFTSTAHASCPWVFHDCRTLEGDCVVRLEHKCRCNSSSSDVQVDPLFDCYSSNFRELNHSSAELLLLENNSSLQLGAFCNSSSCTLVRQWCPWGPWIHTGAVNATHQRKVRYATFCCHPQTRKLLDTAACRHERFQEFMFLPYAASSGGDEEEEEKTVSFFDFFFSLLKTPRQLFQFCIFLIVCILFVGSVRRVILHCSARAQRTAIARRSSSELEELAELENWRRRSAPPGTVHPSAVVGHPVAVELGPYQNRCLEASVNGDPRHSDRTPFATRA